MRLRVLGAAVCALVLVAARLAPVLASPAPAAAAAGLNAASALTAGGSHTCALMESGAVKCWGNNTYGQLGDGSTTNRALPVDVAGLGASATAIAAGVYHTCAITTGGGVACWGWNAYGQLGNGSTVTSSTPVAVQSLGGPATAIAAGWAHTCAVLASGDVKCWGWNVLGELGDGTQTNRVTPVRVAGLGGPATSVDAGADHTCARLASGGVMCWGFNESGQVGDNSTTNRTAPVAVSGLPAGAQSIVLGALHTCVRTPANGASCWGDNWYGQVGDNSTVNRLAPAAVVGMGSGVLAVSAAGFHSCALMTGGALKCWGYNASGQLGDGTKTDRAAPAPVLGLSGPVAAVATGDGHTCALMAAGGVSCWGENGGGQLGNNSNSDSVVPVSVLNLVDGPTATPTRTATRTSTPTRTPTPVSFTPVSWLYLPVIVSP